MDEEVDKQSHPTFEEESNVENDHDLVIVGPKDQFPIVTLMEPKNCGYLYFGLQVEHCRLPIGFMLWESTAKKRILNELKQFIKIMQSDVGIEEKKLKEVTLFKAMIIPPGQGAFLRNRPHIPIALFDIVLLMEFESVEKAQEFCNSSEFKEVLEKYEKDDNVLKTMVLAGSNARRLAPVGDVDHTKDGVFLFNYFYADEVQRNLKVWEYTAGWFQHETALDNSTLILPEQNNDCPYTVINHCRWNRLLDILPSLLFKGSFKEYVLDNFAANNTAANPILYCLG